MGRNEQQHVIGGVELADSFRRRFLGLMWRRDPAGMYLHIPQCPSVHTCFMRTRIDVVFLDRGERVVGVYPEVRPWVFLVGPEGADSAVELPPGEAARREIEIGDLVRCQYI